MRTLTLAEARKMKKLTLQDMKDLDADMLPPSVAAKFLGADPYSLNLMARRHPERMQYPFQIHGKNGTRVSFPRHGLIAWAEGRGRDKMSGDKNDEETGIEY